MLGSGEIEAAGLRVSSLFLQMAIIHYLDFSCYFLHPPLFFSFFLPLFLFQAAWVAAADEGEGWLGADPRWEPEPQLQGMGALEEADFSRCAPEPGDGPRAAPLLALPAREQKGEPGMDGEAAGSAAGHRVC